MKIDRAWAMPNGETFSIPPIRNLIMDVIRDLPADPVIVDPFARNSGIGTITNDLDPEADAMYHMDAFEFLNLIVDDESADMVLFDPPYSGRQISECYRMLDKSVSLQDTQSSFWAKIKGEVRRITKPCGYCITFGWNSGGIGTSYGFSIDRILLVAHGGWHNDTICTVETRDKEQQSKLL